jgi:hypothetical protein
MEQINKLKEQYEDGLITEREFWVLVVDLGFVNLARLPAEDQEADVINSNPI